MAKPSRASDPALQAIFDLAEHLMGDSRIPEQSRALLLDALNLSIASGFEVPIEDALGLKKWGGVSPLQKMKLNRRDQRIRKLWSVVPEWKELSPAAAAKAMATSASRYQSDRWPRERKAVDAPSAEPAATWWKILRTDECIPGERRLAQILHLGNSRRI